MTTETVELASPANELVQQCIDDISSYSYRRIDDGEYITINYWDSLSIEDKNYLINTWNQPLIQYKSIGTCQVRTSCYGMVNAQYLYDFTLVPQSQQIVDRKVIQNACTSCIAMAFVLGNGTSDFTNDNDMSNHRLLPERLFLHPDRPQCSCGRPVPEEDDVCHGAQHMTRWRGVLAIINNDDSEDSAELTHAHCTVECFNCNLTYDTNNVCTYTADSHIYCEGCWENLDTYFCDECDNNTLYRTTHSSVRGQDLCEDHYDEEISCSDCGDDYYEGDGHSCDNNSSTIRNYSYKPTPLFFPDNDQPYYMGIELEVEVRNNNRREVAEYVSGFLSSRAYLKEDGSLTNGFEIVTHPHTLDAYHKLDWSFLNELKRMGVRSWNAGTCGLHVHVSRIAFDSASYPSSDKHLIRFNKFIYDNEQQVVRIAGRSSEYASFRDKGDVIRKVKLTRQQSGRYSAVNLEPEYTAEVRVFRGSLRKERVLSGIEFVHAAVEFTRDMKIVPKQIPFSWARFITYVMSHQDTYPNLFIILNETFARDYDGNEES